MPNQEKLGTTTTGRNQDFDTAMRCARRLSKLSKRSVMAPIVREWSQALVRALSKKGG